MQHKNYGSAGEREREHNCLCYRCKKFKPGEADNCPLAQQNHEMCMRNGLVMPVLECPKFECNTPLRRVYLICPVRHCSDEVRAKIDAYVQSLENKGYIVHYPPRDVKQTETTEHAICEAHARAMLVSDEVHAWWDPTSLGSHFDFGMAYMLFHMWGKKFVLANNPPITKTRSYGNYFRKLAEAEYE